MPNEATPAAPAAPATPQPAAQPLVTTQPNTGLPAPPAFFQDATTEDLAYLQTKGWDKSQNPAKDIYRSYRHLETLFGADRAGNTVVIPKTGADPKDLDVFYNKIGRPEKVDGYEVKDGLAGMSPDQATDFLANAHKLGLTKTQMQGIKTWNDGQAKAMQGKLVEQARIEVGAQEAALKTAWGAAFDQNMNVAKQAAAKLGWSKQQVDAMQMALGYDGVMKLAHQLGSSVLEGKFIEGEGGRADPNTSQVMSPDQAKAALKALEKDAAFKKSWLNKNDPGHAQAVQKKSQLNQWAYPPQQGT